MIFKKELLLSKDTLAVYDKKLTAEPKSESDCLGEDEKISHTVKFDDGKEMDIEICGVQYEEGSSNLPWTQAVLYENGCEVAVSEPSEAFDGEWSLDDDGNTYTVLVKAA